MMYKEKEAGMSELSGACITHAQNKLSRYLFLSEIERQGEANPSDFQQYCGEIFGEEKNYRYFSIGLGRLRKEGLLSRRRIRPDEQYLYRLSEKGIQHLEEARKIFAHLLGDN